MENVTILFFLKNEVRKGILKFRNCLFCKFASCRKHT